uniref:C-mannosyltransferase DPY19L1 n=1 Tax=Panagrellus redivivus TaxID=6233 RepID=A0A7E4VL47_PANRE
MYTQAKSSVRCMARRRNVASRAQDPPTASPSPPTLTSRAAFTNKPPKEQPIRSGRQLLVDSLTHPGPEFSAVEPGSPFVERLKLLLLGIVCVVLWYGHFRFQFTLFENDRHFSHLADFEREMTYRTEMGLYYSYYKTIVQSDTFGEGVGKLLNDNVTEYGHTINTLQRFNLYPEVVVAFLYRKFIEFSTTYNIKTTDCYIINRGESLEPVESCEGLGNPHYFYVTAAFFVSSSVLPSVYSLGYFIGDGHVGGIISAFAFMFNHGEATRAQWTPPLRETFGYPLFLAQSVVLTYLLKHGGNIPLVLAFMLLNIGFLLSWQFAAFVLFAQALALYATYVLEYISSHVLKSLVRWHLASFFVSYLLLFGNKMLLTSMFFNTLCAINIIVSSRQMLNRTNYRLWFIFVHITALIFFTGTSQFLVRSIFDVHDDDHVFDILKSKFSDFANFHTLLYTCAAEFDYLGKEYLTKTFATGLLMFALLSVALVLLVLYKWELTWPIIWYRSIDHSNHGKPFAELVFHLGLLACFSVMAGLIMRLKLFLTPQLCGFLAVALNKNLFQVALNFKPSKWRFPMLVAMVSLMALEGHTNLKKQLAIHGEYSNIEQENLFNWVTMHTKQNDVFAGSMPLMANLKLSTERPIVNHPHYENADIRERTLKVYAMYSRRPLDEVYKTLKDMKVNYYIFQPFSCGNPHPKKDCTYTEMWDIQEPKNKNREALCDLFGRAISGKRPELINPFKVVYGSRSYVVLKL